VFRAALCSPLLSPFGLESVTVFDPAPLCASPSQKPACGITAQASSCRPSPDGIELDRTSRPWERMPGEIPTETLPRETTALATTIQPLEEQAVDRPLKGLKLEKLSPSASDQDFAVRAYFRRS
jgi:hypothetical protein